MSNSNNRDIQKIPFNEFKAQLVAYGDSKDIKVNVIAHNEALKGIYVFFNSIEEAFINYQNFCRRWKAVNKPF